MVLLEEEHWPQHLQRVCLIFLFFLLTSFVSCVFLLFFLFFFSILTIIFLFFILVFFIFFFFFFLFYFVVRCLLYFPTRRSSVLGVVIPVRVILITCELFLDGPTRRRALAAASSKGMSNFPLFSSYFFCVLCLSSIFSIFFFYFDYNFSLLYSCFFHIFFLFFFVLFCCSLSSLFPYTSLFRSRSGHPSSCHFDHM